MKNDLAWSSSSPSLLCLFVKLSSCEKCPQLAKRSITLKPLCLTDTLVTLNPHFFLSFRGRSWTDNGSQVRHSVKYCSTYVATCFFRLHQDCTFAELAHLNRPCLNCLLPSRLTFLYENEFYLDVFKEAFLCAFLCASRLALKPRVEAFWNGLTDYNVWW